MTAAHRPIVHADARGWLGNRQRNASHQAKHGRRARRHTEVDREAGRGLCAQSNGNCLKLEPLAAGTPSVRLYGRTQPLGEGLPLASSVVAAESADLDVIDDGPTQARCINHPAPIPAVNPPGTSTARWTLDPGRRASQGQGHLVGIGFDLEHLQAWDFQQERFENQGVAYLSDEASDAPRRLIAPSVSRGGGRGFTKCDGEPNTADD